MFGGIQALSIPYKTTSILLALGTLIRRLSAQLSMIPEQVLVPGGARHLSWIGFVGLVGSARRHQNLHYLNRDRIDRNIADYPGCPDRTVPTIPIASTVPPVPTVRAIQTAPTDPTVPTKKP